MTNTTNQKDSSAASKGSATCTGTENYLHRCVDCPAKYQKDSSAASEEVIAFPLALNVQHPDCHKAANAFWTYWNENGETHKHGYYESTWGAINRAIRMIGVVPWTYGQAPQAATQTPGSSATSGERAEYWDTTNGPEGRYAFYRIKVGDGDIPQTLYATSAPQAATPLQEQDERALPTGWRDKLRWSKANTDYHGYIAFTPAQLQHFVSMLTQQAAPEAPTLTRALREVYKQQADPKLATTGATAYERFLHAELARLQAAVIADCGGAA